MCRGRGKSRTGQLQVERRDRGGNGVCGAGQGIGRWHDGAGSEERRGRARARGRGRLDDPHPVTAGGDELGDSVGERGPRVDVEDWVAVFAVADAALGEDDGDEMDARGAE